MPFFDFSWAVPWLVAGLVIGFILSWILGKLFGGNHTPDLSAELNDVRAELAAAHRNAADLSQTVNLLQSDKARIASELNQVSPKATLVPQLQARLAELTQTQASSQNAADLARSQVASLQKELETQAGTARQYEAEYRKLHAAYEALKKEKEQETATIAQLRATSATAAEATHEAARIKSELAAAESVIQQYRRDHESLGKSEHALRAQIVELETRLRAAPARDLSGEVARLNGEANSLRAEVARLTSALASAPKEDHSAEANTLRAEVARLTSALASAPKVDLSGEVNRLNGEVARLTSALASAPSSDLSGEVTRLKSELTATSAALDSARAAERSAAMELHVAKNDMNQLRSGLEETSRILAERHAEITGLKAKLASLPADVETFRRYKEALDAANRIASGQG